MKLLAVFFLVGLALTSAIPAPSSELSLDEVEELDFLLSDFHLETEDDDVKSELGKELRRKLDEILEKIKNAVDNGKAVGEDVMHKMKEIREQMRDLKVDLGKKAKDLLEKIKDKAKDYWQRILDKLGVKDESKRSIRDNVFEKIKERFENILEKMKDGFDNGKNFDEGLLDKLKNILERFKGRGFSKIAKDFLDKLSGKHRDIFEQIFEKLGIQTRSLQFAEEDGSSDLSGGLKEKFEELMKKITDALENGKSFRDGLEKFGEIRQQLRELANELGENGKEMVKKVREKIQEYIHKLFEKFTDKRSVDLREYLKRLRDLIRDSFDVEKAKEQIEKIFGKGSDVSEYLINKIKEKGGRWKEKILDFIDRFLEPREEKRSIKEVYEKIKNYFKDLQIELKEKFVKFGEWAKKKYDEGLEKGKDKVENLRKIAREFIHDAKIIRKDVAEQAKEFFREYKEDLGALYDEVREKLREILKEY